MKRLVLVDWNYADIEWLTIPTTTSRNPVMSVPERVFLRHVTAPFSIQ